MRRSAGLFCMGVIILEQRELHNTKHGACVFVVRHVLTKRGGLRFPLHWSAFAEHLQGHIVTKRPRRQLPRIVGRDEPNCAAALVQLIIDRHAKS